MEKSWKYIAISVSAFICYCNTLWGSFLFDDSEAIVKNKDVMPSTPLSEIFNNDFWGTNISLNSSHKSYRPLTILSYRLNVIYSNNVLDSFQFHATNVILYGLLCLLTIPVFELFLKKRSKHEYIHEIAFMSSLLFTVHPVHTESVAAIVGRADILGSILFLATLLLYHGCLRQKSVLCFCASLIVSVAAVLCKENAIMALCMCIVYDIFQQKRRKRAWINVFTLYFVLRNVFIVVFGVVILYYRLKIMNFEGPTFTSIDNPAAFSDSFFVKLFTYSYIYFLNLLILIWPEWLCFDWSMGCIPLIENFCDIRIIFVISFWIFVISMCFTILKKIFQTGIIDGSVMGVSLMILPFVPASNLFFTVGFVIAERTLLLPSAGFCFLIVIGFNKLLSLSSLHDQKIFKKFFYFLCVFFASRTIHRNFDWLKEEKLFLSALEVCPLNAKVHYNIAKVAADQNLKDLAFKGYRKALELNPNYEQAMNNLANLLREEKKYEEAERLLRKSLDVRPNFAAAWMNLGIVLTNLNKTEEAEQCYKTAIKHRNRYPDCYYNLGNLYLDQKRNEEALKAWEMAVLHRPTHVAAWSNTLVLLDSMKRYEEALDLVKTALSYNPLSAALHFSTANTLGKVQEFERAEAHFLEAINLNPTNALYISNLGVLYHRWGKREKARSMYQKALKIDPNMRTTQLNLKKLDRV